MLQTLAENAVKHGIAKSRAGGAVTVRARLRDDGWLELAVANTGAPFVRSRGGTGLANTMERLRLMYGPASALAIASEDGTTVVRFAVSGLAVAP
jgi:sensor histidine kinase YesM